MMIPVITLIGQKNVGKSTLFNRLTCTKNALVTDEPGLTRDRQYGKLQHKKFQAIIVDTGGFDRLSNTSIQNYINNQVILAITESCVIFFIVNGQFEKSLVEYDTIDYLRKFKKIIFIVINKIDDYKYNNKYYTMWDYYDLGIKNIIFISAMHGYGIENLLKKTFLEISKNLYGFVEDSKLCFSKKNKIDPNDSQKLLVNLTVHRAIKLAVVGRPNVGKSTFINYISKSNRVITSNIPGTTRNTVYIPVVYNNQEYILIDTAGIRKKKQINSLSEKISVLKTLKILKTVHVTLFMLDASTGVVDQDFSLLRFVLNNSKSTIIVINKYDTLSSTIIQNNIIDELAKKINFLNFSKIHFISSLYGYGIKHLFKLITEIYKCSLKNFSTAQLMRIMYKALIIYPPPIILKTRIIPKLKYVHIGGYNPIIIVIHGNQVSQLPEGYRKFLKKYFYHSLNMHGISMRIQFKDTAISVSRRFYKNS